MDFQIPEMTEAQRGHIQCVLDWHSDLIKLDAAVDSKDQDIKDAEARLEVAAKAQEQCEVDLALATDDARAKAIERNLKKCAEARAEVQADLDRQRGVRAALLKRLAEMESAHETKKAAFQVFARAYGSEVLTLLGEHVAQAARPLIEALRLAAVTSSAMGVSINGRLLELHVPDLRNGGMLLNGLALTGSVDGSPVRLVEVGDDQALEDICRHLGEPQQVLRKLSSYRSRATRLQEQQRAQIFQSRTAPADPRDRLRP